MKQIILYTGGGVSLSPEAGEGRRVSAYVRLEAEEGKGITDGETVTTCVIAKAADAVNWKDCDAPSAEPDDLTPEEALGIITGGVV